MQQDTTAFFQKDFQRAIVAHILRTYEFLSELNKGGIDQKDFSNPIHRIVIQAIRAILDVRKEIDPNVCIPRTTLALQLKSMIRNNIIMKEEIDPLIDEVDMMYEMELDVGYYLRLLPDYLSEIRISNLLKSVEKKNTSKVDLGNQIYEVLSETRRGKSGGEIISPLIDCQMGDQPVVHVPTMINVIDMNMNGGHGLGELGVVCGITGLGKTTLGINFCWGAAKLGFSAAMVTLELPQKKISERLYSRITGIPYSRIRLGDNGDMTAVKREVMERLAMEDEETRKRFTIWDYSNDQCSITTLDSRMNELKKRDALPMMLFVDWIDAMGTDPSERKNGMVIKELRHQLQFYSQGLSDLAKKYNVAIWTATQSNKDGENSSTVRMSNAAEGFSKAWRCSVFLGIGATDEDREENRLKVTASKMRDGNLFQAYIYSDMSTQIFTDVPIAGDQTINFSEMGT
jgi:replicative DNA helicase